MIVLWRRLWQVLGHSHERERLEAYDVKERSSIRDLTEKLPGLAIGAEMHALSSAHFAASASVRRCASAKVLNAI